MHRRHFIYVIALVALVVLGITASHLLAPKPQTHHRPQPSAFNKQAHSLNRADSIWVVVNKKRPLDPKTYVPSDLVSPAIPKRDAEMRLRHDTAKAMESLFNAAAEAGVPLKLVSAYRSYDYQVELYNGYVAGQGQSVADSQSARPGYSEHQTGMAADVTPLAGDCNIAACFADTPAGKWLAANAYNYGFIIRYPRDLTAITGYVYEPWHVRYVGRPLASRMHEQNILTLEQFFDLPPAPSY